MLLVTLRYPFAGILMWTWFSLMNPHQETYGIAQGLPFNAAIALVTIAAWLISKESKRWTADLTPKLMVIFIAWAILNSFFAVQPDFSWQFCDRTIKIFALAMMMLFLARSRTRIHASIWMIVLSLSYYGVKGAIFVVITGGNYIVFGPPATQISDNNQLAVALVMCLPLLNYLRLQSRLRSVQLVLIVVIVADVISVLGTKSRGGFIAIVAEGFVFWLSARHKVRYAVAVACIGALALSLMPASYFERLDTMQNLQNDASFQGRVTAWSVAFNFALDHFPLGAGFAGASLSSVYNHYFPNEPPHAAHSIYFEVLGDLGFVGLTLYLGLMATALYTSWRVIKASRGRPELGWAYELAKAIQVSLAAFYVGGAGLSMAYYDIPIVLLSLLSCMRALAEPRTARSAGARARSLPAAQPALP